VPFAVEGGLVAVTATLHRAPTAVPGPRTVDEQQGAVWVCTVLYAREVGSAKEFGGPSGEPGERGASRIGRGPSHLQLCAELGRGSWPAGPTVEELDVCPLGSMAAARRIDQPIDRFSECPGLAKRLVVARRLRREIALPEPAREVEGDPEPLVWFLPTTGERGDKFERWMSEPESELLDVCGISGRHR
jgi:hypothetical protein